MIIIVFLTAFLSSSDIGTSMYPLLKIGLGPRAAALGESFTGLADDITAAYWNSAGLAELNDVRFFVSHQEWFEDIRDEYIIIGMPGAGGYFTLSGLYSSIPNVEIWNDDNEYIRNQTIWSGVWALSYGRKITRGVQLGITGKTLMEDLYEQSFIDAAIDISAKLNLNDKICFGGIVKDVSYRPSVPSEIRLGGCYQGVYHTKLLLSASLPTDNVVRLNIGSEYALSSFFNLRIGWRSGPASLAKLGWLSGLTGGFGIAFRGYTLDYALVPYGKLGLTHRISLSGGLSLIKGYNSLTITIMDGDTKESLEGRIVLTGAMVGDFTIGPTGKIHFRNLSAGWTHINVLVADYPQYSDSVFNHPEGDVKKNILLYRTHPGIFRGIVFDAVTKRPISASALYQGMAYGKVNNDSTAGSFVINNLPAGRFILTISGSDTRYIPQICSLSLEAGKLTEREFYLLRKREKIILAGIHFDTGLADLKPESYPFLDEAGKILIDNPDITVEISGHTDPREINNSSYPSNWELSFARAEVVMKYIIEKYRVDPERLSARGYADTQPIADNNSEEGMTRNRRTEFRINE